MEKGHLEGWVTHFFLVCKSNEFEYIHAWNIGEINVLWLLSVIHNGLSKFGESILNSVNKIGVESWTYFSPPPPCLMKLLWVLSFILLIHFLYCWTTGFVIMKPFTYFKSLKAYFIYFSNIWQYFELVWFYFCDSVI